MQNIGTRLALIAALIQCVGGASCSAEMVETDQVAAALLHAQYIDLDTTPVASEGELRYGDADEYVAGYHLTEWAFRRGFNTVCPLPCTLSDIEWIDGYARNLALYNVDVEIENSGAWPLYIEYTLEGVCNYHLYVRTPGESTAIEGRDEAQARSFELQPGEVHFETFSCGDDATSLDDAELHVKQVALAPAPTE